MNAEAFSSTPSLFVRSVSTVPWLVFMLSNHASQVTFDGALFFPLLLLPFAPCLTEMHIAC